MRRRAGGERAGGYPGANVIDGHLTVGVSVKRVGLVGLEKVPVREGTAIVDAHGSPLGRVTSGTLGPQKTSTWSLASAWQRAVTSDTADDRARLLLPNFPTTSDRRL